MNYPPYSNDPNDPHSQPTTAGQYPTFNQQPGQSPQWGQQPPPPPQFPTNPGQYSQSGQNFPPYQGQYPQHTQPGQFGLPQQAPQKLSLWRRFRNRRKRFQFGVGCATLFIVLFLCTGMLAAIGSTLPNPPVAAQPSPTETQHQVVRVKTTDTPEPTPIPIPPTPTPSPQPIHYPPTTAADLRDLAAKGDTNAIHEFDSESVGLTGVCPPILFN